MANFRCCECSQRICPARAGLRSTSWIVLCIAAASGRGTPVADRAGNHSRHTQFTRLAGPRYCALHSGSDSTCRTGARGSHEGGKVDQPVASCTSPRYLGRRRCRGIRGRTTVGMGRAWNPTRVHDDYRHQRRCIDRAIRFPRPDTTTSSAMSRPPSGRTMSSTRATRSWVWRATAWRASSALTAAA